MDKTVRHRNSLRTRLILGFSLMLVPLMAIAGTSFWFFEQTVSSFEKSENKRLEELFPLDQLDGQLMAVSNFVETIEIDQDWQNQAELDRLSHDIQQTLTVLLNSPSQLDEKHNLVLGIQAEWHQVKSTADQLKTLATQHKTAPMRQHQHQLEKHLHQAIERSRRLNALLLHFQTDDNLKRAQAWKQRVRITILVISVFAVSLVIVSALVLSQSILKPLQLLKTGVAQFGDGDLSQRIHLTSQDELEQLADTINWMAERLEQSQQSLLELATVDGLTGVFNRREFNRRLTVELERSRRENHPVSLLMVDIDHFKKLNDTYGHQSGDDALRHVSHLIKTEVRPGDLPARYGGEEFAVILPYADRADAFAVGERLCSLLEAQDIAIQEGQTIRVTASLGCATFPIDAQSEEKLIAAADGALYQAKKSGRNQVCMASPELAQIA